MVAELDGFEEVLEAGFLFDRFHQEVGAVHQSLLGSRPQGWPCTSTGSRMGVGQNSLPGRSGEWASSRRIACRS